MGEPMALIAGVEAKYDRLVRACGRPAPSAKRLDLQPPVADDGETDCWTHAWEVARRIGGRYVEGVCALPGGRVSRHAWVEEDTPFGACVVVETTVGYEAAYNYIGVVVDCSVGGHVEAATRGQSPRSSVLQLALAAGFDFARTLAMVEEA